MICYGIVPYATFQVAGLIMHFMFILVRILWIALSLHLTLYLIYGQFLIEYINEMNTRSVDNLPINYLRVVENSDCLVRSFDSTRHHRTEGRAHTVRSIML